MSTPATPAPTPTTRLRAITYLAAAVHLDGTLHPPTPTPDPDDVHAAAQALRAAYLRLSVNDLADEIFANATARRLVLRLAYPHPRTPPTAAIEATYAWDLTAAHEVAEKTILAGALMVRRAHAHLHNCAPTEETTT